jgi:hypothetical protein
MHRAQEEIDGMVAYLAPMHNSLLNRFAKVIPHENAQESILVHRL